MVYICKCLNPDCQYLFMGCGIYYYQNYYYCYFTYGKFYIIRVTILVAVFTINLLETLL